MIHDGSSSPALPSPIAWGRVREGAGAGALWTRCVPVLYGEGLKGEPAGRRPVAAADRRLQQKRS
jgi:hypothetical protein